MTKAAEPHRIESEPDFHANLQDWMTVWAPIGEAGVPNQVRQRAIQNGIWRDCARPKPD